MAVRGVGVGSVALLGAGLRPQPGGAWLLPPLSLLYPDRTLLPRLRHSSGSASVAPRQPGRGIRLQSPCHAGFACCWVRLPLGVAIHDLGQAAANGVRSPCAYMEPVGFRRSFLGVAQFADIPVYGAGALIYISNHAGTVNRLSRKINSAYGGALGTYYRETSRNGADAGGNRFNSGGPGRNFPRT